MGKSKGKFIFLLNEINPTLRKMTFYNVYHIKEIGVSIDTL